MCIEDSKASPKVYLFGDTGQRIEIATEVLALFARHQQISATAPEAGGILFAVISPQAIQITSATEPSKSDICSRFLFRSSRRSAKAVIKRQFKRGLHFVGEWHTHPEPAPTPSQLDLKSMAESFNLSKHQLDHFIMIIVGNKPGDMRLWVSMHDGKEVLKLSEKERME